MGSARVVAKRVVYGEKAGEGPFHEPDDLGSVAGKIREDPIRSAEKQQV